MLLRLSDCFFFTLRCQPALVRVPVTLCASAMMEFMPCATRSCLWRDFDMPLRPGCHHPSYQSDFLVKTHLPPLVSLVSPIFRCHLQSLHLLSCFVRRHSSALRPVFTQPARTAHSFTQCHWFLAEGEGFEPPMFPIFQSICITAWIDLLLSTTQPSFRKISLFSRTGGLHSLKSS